MHKQILQAKDYLRIKKIGCPGKPTFPPMDKLIDLSVWQGSAAVIIQEGLLTKDMDQTIQGVTNGLYCLMNIVAQLGLGDKLEESFDAYHREKLLAINKQPKGEKKKKEVHNMAAPVQQTEML